MIYFESENAVSKDMLEQRGLDTNRIVIIGLQQFKSLDYKQLEFLTSI